LRDDPDGPVGYNHGDGGIRLANTSAQMDGYRHFASITAVMGAELEVIYADVCARRHPLIATDNLLGCLCDASDGHIAPRKCVRHSPDAARRPQLDRPYRKGTTWSARSW